MITAAAICPCPPLLARELTGQAEILPELRAACAAAVARLTASAPDLIVVAGPDDETARWPADGRLDLAAYAPALGRERPPAPAPGAAPVPGGPVPGGPVPGGPVPGGPVSGGAVSGGLAPGAGASWLPLSLGIGARLLDEAGYAGPRALRGVAVLAAPADCLRLGAEIAAAAPRVALLAMGDGSARRSQSAPGYLDQRAAPFDAAVQRAVGDGDLGALAAIDPALAGELLAAGRPAWQVLAGALDGRPLEAEILYAGDPFGVAYLVAALSPVPAAS